MINLLTSKIFHDIGNAIVPLNFFIELNRDDPSGLDFQELISVNKQIILSFNVLKYAFLKDDYGEKALNDLKEYFHQKKLSFNMDHLELNQDCFVVVVHVLMILNRILQSHAEISVSYNDGMLSFHCKNSSFEQDKLKIFNNLDADDNVHIIYIRVALKRLDLRLSYKVISPVECVIEIA